MNFKTLIILTLSLFSAGAFAQKKKRERHSDRNALADAYFAARIQGAQSPRSKSRANDNDKTR